MSKVPDIRIRGASRASIPAGYVIGRVRGKGPPQLLNVQALRRIGAAGLNGKKGDAGSAAWGTPAPWLTATPYVATDPRSVVTINGSSYVCLVSHTSGTFATDLAASKWLLIASKGDTGATGAAGATGATGPTGAAGAAGAAGATGATGATGAVGSNGTNGATPFTAETAWLTATAYVVGPPASYVSQGGSSYVCLVGHTSGTFATDLAAAKWGLVAAKGDTGSSGSVSTGTSFPGSPGDGDLFFRSDRGIMYFYDLTNTRWLSVTQYVIDLPVVSALFPISATSQFMVGMTQPWSGIYSFLVERFQFTSFLTLATTASNYYTAALLAKSAAADATLGTASSQSTTQSNWTMNSISINTVVASTVIGFEVSFTKVGTQSLYAKCSLTGRLVG